MIAAAIEAANAIAIVIGLCGLSGCIFTALRYNRDDTTVIVQQQSTVLHDMQALADEQRQRVTDLTEERDELRHQVDRLTQLGYGG